MVLVVFERVVMDDSEPTGLRVYAWAKLVKVWASLRWSDLQAIRPGELKLVEGRLATALRRTKTSGPNRRIKEMPLCVSEAAFFENPDWLKIGFELLQWLATFSRDYLLPKLKPGICRCGGRLGRYPPEDRDACDSVGILDGAFREVRASDWIGSPGRQWAREGPPGEVESDTYARSYGGRVAKLQLKFAVAARDENCYHVLDEREVASSLQDWLKDRRSLPEETAAEVAGKLDLVPDGGRGAEADSDSQEDPEPPAAKVPRAEERRST